MEERSTNEEQQPAGISRRDVISRLLGAGCTACLGALATSCPGGSDWGKPVKHAEGSMQDQLEHNAADVPLNSVKPVVVGGGAAFLVHYEAAAGEQWIALENKCTHKKSKIDFIADGNYFKCPLHKSEYSMDGSLRDREGDKGWPAKEPLKSWPVEVRGSRVVIMADAAALVQQDTTAAGTEDDSGGRGRGRGRGGDDDNKTDS